MPGFRDFISARVEVSIVDNINYMHMVRHMTRLTLISLDDTVVFPGMPVTLALDAGNDKHIFLMPRHGNKYAKVGVVAEVTERVQLPGRGYAVSLKGLHRGVPGAAQTDPDGRFASMSRNVRISSRLRRKRTNWNANIAPLLRRSSNFAATMAASAALFAPSHIPEHWRTPPATRRISNFEQKIELLETLDVVDRLKLALRFQQERLAELHVRQRIRDEVESGTQKQQREYFLRRQMDAIRKELGENEGSVIEEYRKKIADAQMPEAVQQQAERELARLEKMGESNAEASMIRTYLDWLLAVPWSKRSDERLDPKFAREVLDSDHAGLDDVKRRISEYLAVRKLRTERGFTDNRRSGAILTLIGPPGTGKTSIGESIARATGRKFVRMSLGGVRDEAEIRGHRRTYIGALPGRLVRALRDAGTMNPVIMLDEVDKLGADWRGDPSAALLEVLDPAQNHAFQDHYLDVELDLSHVLFIATANVAETIPGPLLDRMEVIRFDGYTTEEKVAIARGYLWPRQIERNGLRIDEVTVDDAVLRQIVTGYTREAGVRQLERELGTLLRKTATAIASGDRQAAGRDRSATLREALGRPKVHHEAAARTATPGVATGLAVTGVGGDVLFVEAAAMAGKSGLVLTGQLGDVMKESARIALTYVKSHAAQLEIDERSFEGREFHIHVPAGAIPKDGPSAGVTIVTALASLLSGRPVKSTVGMTGEVTLQGRVLPIGGLKQKIMAAQAAGLDGGHFPGTQRTGSG